MFFREELGVELCMQLERVSELADEKVHILVQGLQAGHYYTIHAHMLDEFGREWRSHAEYQADDLGVINVVEQAPLTGTYEGIDGMGLLWSLRLHSNPPGMMPFFLKINTEPLYITFAVYKDAAKLIEQTISLAFKNKEIREEMITDEFVGKYFVAEQGTNLPALIVIGGSGGGFAWSEQMASLLAARGFATLAVAYFDYEGRYGLPSGLAEIELESFERAASWLRKRKETDADRVGVLGISKGGELSLLLGSYFPNEVKTVVAFAPSLYVYQGIRMGEEDTVSSWSYRGKPLDYVSYPPEYKSSMDFDKTTLRDMYIQTLADKEAISAARIPVELMQSNLMLITGDLDALGPTSEMAEATVQILREHQYPYEINHLRYSKGDHSFFIPNMPPNVMSHYAHARDLAEADRDAWDNMIQFLNRVHRR